MDNNIILALDHELRENQFDRFLLFFFFPFNINILNVYNNIICVRGIYAARTSRPSPAVVGRYIYLIFFFSF